MHTSIDDGQQNQLILLIEAGQYSAAELLQIQATIERIVSDKQLVAEYRTEFEDEASAFRTYVITSTQPIVLWSRIRYSLFANYDLAIRLHESTWARWTGEDPFCDSIWAYRHYTYGKGQLDGFENRVQCTACSKFFWIGLAEDDGLCPYCKAFDAAFLIKPYYQPPH